MKREGLQYASFWNLLRLIIWYYISGKARTERLLDGMRDGFAQGYPLV